MTLLRRLSIRLYDGSVVIGWRIARWPWATAEGGSWFGRLIVVAVVGAMSWRVPWLFCGVWIVAAWRAAAHAPEPDPEVLPELDLTAGEIREALRLELVDTVVELAEGAQGVHLDHVFADWVQRGLVSPGRTLSEFRRMCEQIGVPVRGSLKVAGTVRIGIHLDDLPSPSPAGPGEGPVMG